MNAAKLELALVVMLCIIAALLTLRLPLEPLVEVAVLGFIAAVGAVWIILRTRRAVRRLSIEAQGENSNGAP